ncbi:MAG: hypothetical protein ABSC94_15925, partial [Polyangiaceae bacterium]
NHMPSRDTRWSNGASFSAGTAVGKDFIRQFGGSPLGGLPELNASVIYQTMLEFTRLNPGYVPDDWLRIERFAREAAAEIQLAKRSDRLRMQASVLIATQRGGIHARALLAQARSIAVSFASPGLRSYVRARLSKPRLEGPMLQVPMPSLTEAMRRVAQEQIKISAPPIHGADPGTAQLD